jgi:hypothetical protein
METGKHTDREVDRQGQINTQAYRHGDRETGKQIYRETGIQGSVMGRTTTTADNIYRAILVGFESIDCWSMVRRIWYPWRSFSS